MTVSNGTKVGPEGVSNIRVNERSGKGASQNALGVNRIVAGLADEAVIVPKDQ